MPKIIALIFFLIFILVSCGESREQKQKFFPETIDGVTNFTFADHTMEDKFTGDWGAPVLGQDKKYFRKLGKGTGELKFLSVGSEKYILEAIFTSPDNNLKMRLNGHDLELKGSKKFLDKKLIKDGENSLIFFHKKDLKFNNISIFPKRVVRNREFSKLARNKKVLFLPGTLRYYVKPSDNEYISIRLDLNGKEIADVNVTINSPGEKLEYKDKIKDRKNFTVKLIKDKFQEVKISLAGLKTRFVKILESFLVHRITCEKKRYKKIKKISNLVKGKNLLIVLLDATRNDRMGYNGYLRRTTPNTDQFSSGSLIFRNCYSEASYTLASTGTLLTGLPPDSHGVISKFYSSLNRRSTTLADMFKSKGYFTAAISGNPFFGKAFNYDKGFTEFKELFINNPVVLAEEFVEPFNKMIDKSEKKKFFFYLHIREPHDPFAMPQPFSGKFQKKFLKYSVETPSVFKASEGRYNKDNKIRDLLNKLYDENLSYGDMVFGKILGILKEKNLFSDTVIVFLSDHGEAIGENGVYGHGHVLFQQSIRIPMVIKIPGVEGDSFNFQVITSDLVRTLSEIFRLPYPYKDISCGRNLFNQETERRLFVRSINVFNYPGYMIQQYPYKLIIHFPFDKDKIKLYNLKDDPEEHSLLEGNRIVKKTLLFYLFNHLKISVEAKQEIVNPNLRKGDIKSLESLGYL